MKLVRSLLIITLTTGLIIKASQAFFSDSVTNSDNTFTAGSLNLKLNGKDTASAVWAMSDMAPGDEVSASINLTNSGNIEADHLEINSVTNQVYDLNDDASPDIDQFLEIISAVYDNDNLLVPPGKQLIDANNNGWYDLDDLEDSANSGEGGVLDNLTPPPVGGINSKTFSLTIRFKPEAGNQYQGDSNNMSLVFQLNQDPSQ